MRRSTPSSRWMAYVLIVIGLAVVGCSSSEAEPEPTTTSLAAAGSTVASSPGSSERLPVIVDYSPTVSDVGALLYLLSHPEVEVVAITLPGAGEAGCELGLEVTLGILAMFERDDVPVACDPDLPEGAETWPEEFLAGMENLTFGLPEATSTPDDRVAHQLIAEIIAASDGPVVLYAVAPLTNVARALDEHPEAANGIDRIVIMGGAVDAPGNVPGSDAEWNLWIDVPSAARVVASQVAVTLVPLDATNDVPVPALWQKSLDEAEQTEAIAYLGNLVRAFPAVTSGFFYLWDELAASVAAAENVIEGEELALIVVEDPGAGYGSTKRDSEGTPVSVANAVPDPQGFYAHFLSTLSDGLVETPTPVALDESSAPDSVDASSSPEEVLAFWLFNAIAGDVEAAAPVVAPGAPWPGFTPSADAFVEGAAPYASFDIEMSCTSAADVALCEATWNDLWMAEIPELDRGDLRAQAEVVDGLITAFREFVVGAEVRAAFDGHAAWLEAEHPDRFGAMCGIDPASSACSQLFVDSVSDWVAGR